MTATTSMLSWTAPSVLVWSDCARIELHLRRLLLVEGVFLALRVKERGWDGLLCLWLVNGWIRVVRALGFQGECRTNVHPEARGSQRIPRWPYISRAPSLPSMRVTRATKTSCVHTLLAIHTTCSTRNSWKVGKTTRLLYNSILVNFSSILT